MYIHTHTHTQICTLTIYGYQRVFTLKHRNGVHTLHVSAHIRPFRLRVTRTHRDMPKNTSYTHTHTPLPMRIASRFCQLSNIFNNLYTRAYILRHTISLLPMLFFLHMSAALCSALQVLHPLTASGCCTSNSSLGKYVIRAATVGAILPQSRGRLQ
jgi:hypothetical protein